MLSLRSSLGLRSTSHLPPLLAPSRRLVGLIFERTAACVVAIYGTLEAGAGYEFFIDDIFFI